MIRRQYWSSSNLTPENIALVKYYHSLHLPLSRISQHTGLSLYYIRQIVNGVDVPTNGKHRPTGNVDSIPERDKPISHPILHILPSPTPAQ